MNKLFVWLTGRLAPLWRWLGADPKALTLILDAKLKIDDRGGYVYGRQNAGGKSGMHYLFFLFVAIFGAVLVVLPAMMSHQPTAMGLVFAAWLIYVGMMLITEMSENMFDVRDLYLLLSRPINDLTFSLSRGLHVAVFTAKFTLCLAFALCIYFVFWRGILAFLLFAFVGLLAALVTMSSTLALYLLLLRKIDPGRLRKLMGWVQIVLGIVVFTSYQLPQLMDFSEDSWQSYQLVDTLWGYTFPGFWLGALWGGLSGYALGIHGIVQAALGLLCVLAGGWFYLRQSKDYGARLMGLRLSTTVKEEQEGTSAPIVDRGRSPSKKSGGFALGLARLFTRPGIERASFLFHWRMLSRDMALKQRTYPQLVLIPICFFIFVLRDEDVMRSAGTEGGISYGWGVFMLYLLALAVTSPMQQVKIGEQPQAAWVFHSLPHGRSGRLQYGQYASVLAHFLLIPALLLYPLVLWLFNGVGLWDLALATANIMLLGMVFQAVEKSAPFSMSKETAQSKTFGPMLLTFFLMPVFGLGHWLLAGWQIGLIGATVLAWLILGSLIYRMRRS